MVEVNALREMPKSRTIDSRSAGDIAMNSERSAHVLLVDDEFGELMVVGRATAGVPRVMRASQ